MMTTHKATMDSLTIVTTTLVILVLVIVGFFPILSSEFHLSNLWIPNPEYVLPFAFLILLFITYGFSPKGYRIQDGQLSILRPLKAKNYPLAEIQSVKVVDGNSLKGSIRLFGVGGLFGYFGLFRNRTYGNMVWYATRRNHVVAIERKNARTIIITPDDPEGFVAEYQSILGK